VPDIQAPAEPPGLLQLFLAFAKISLSGFGGVLVFARRAIVEKYRWMSADEFNETYALCHFLPGPNICNLSVVFGARIRGIPGSFAAFTGLVGPPVVIVSALAMIYARYGEIPALQRTLAGVSCAAVGLVIGVAARMMGPLVRRRDPVAIGFLIAVFVAIGLLRLPLPPVLLAAIPLSIAVTYAMRRNMAS
jgi:chromate transporter